MFTVEQQQTKALSVRGYTRLEERSGLGGTQQRGLPTGFSRVGQ